MAGSAHTPLAALELVSGEMFERWDTDQRAGKLLTSLSGHAPGYDPRVETIRRACAAAPTMLEALKELLGACESDCGVPGEHDGDDEPVGASATEPMALTFGMLRRARAAIALAEGGE